MLLERPVCGVNDGGLVVSDVEHRGDQLGSKPIRSMWQLEIGAARLHRPRVAADSAVVSG